MERKQGRLVVALGGNAIAPRGAGGTSTEQTANLAAAAEAIAELVAAGREPVVTHGNGPQVGNLLLKNELAADIVPAMPLDWCVAQTQATIGFTLVTQLERALAVRGAPRLVVSLVTRVLVDRADPGFAEATKPIGRWRPDGTRRLVPSPRPQAILDLPVISTLLAEGALVIAGGGGGIAMVGDDDGFLVGVEAVIDKDRCAALLAESVGAERLVIATDVEAVELDHGGPDARPIGSITAGELGALLDAGHFPPGSMGPKVEAAVEFASNPGCTAAIGSLDQLAEVTDGRAGTQVT